jgi:integrase
MPSVELITAASGEKCYRARWRTPEGASRSKRFPRRRDALSYLTGVEPQKVQGLYADPAESRRTTVASYAETWAASRHWRPSSRAKIEGVLRNHVLPTFGSRPIGSLRPTEIDTWVRRLSETLAPATVRTAGWTLKSLLAAAVEDRVIARSPATKMRLPRPQKRRVVPLTSTQVADLAREIHDRYRRAILIAAATGLRIGELVGLTVDDLDVDGHVLHVTHQVVDLTGQPLTLGPLKTDASPREIPVPESVITLLLEQVSEYGLGPEGAIFTTGSGRLVRPGHLRTRFDRAVELAGLSAKTVPHDLRHTFASSLLDAGCSIREVQERLGHANATETLNTYSHLMPDAESRTRDAIGANLARITNVLGNSVSVSCPSDPPVPA